MKKLLLTSSMCLALALGLTGCASNISPDTVTASNANDVQTAVEGVIVSKRNVTVKEDSNMVGTLAGAGIGAVAGSAVGGGNMKYITGIAGAVAGGAAGNAIEDKMTTQQGIEYIVKLAQQDSGTTTVQTTGQTTSTTTVSSKSSKNRFVTVVQGQGQQVLNVGQKVLIAGVDGGHARIISTIQ
jgi:outer membrane lipoprotein SlyB